MHRKALWIAAIAFSAFSAPAMAAEYEERPGRGPGGEMQGSRAEPNLPTFSQADVDNNGVVDPDEASDIGLGFSGADRNNDGYIQFDEYQTATGRFRY